MGTVRRVTLNLSYATRHSPLVISLRPLRLVIFILVAAMLRYVCYEIRKGPFI